jgi:nicotinamidase-related amidase
MPQPNSSDLTAPVWDRACLLTIDMQNDFALPDGSGFVAGTDLVLPQLEQLLAAFRTRRRPVFHAIRLYLKDGSNAELCRRDLLQSGVSVVRPGTKGARAVEVIQGSTPDSHEALLGGEFLTLGEAEWMFYKPRWSAFYATELEARLQGLGVDTIVVAGCNFPNCPSATLFDASERDFRVVVAADAVSRVDEAGLRWCRGIGVAPMSAAEVERAIMGS